MQWFPFDLEPSRGEYHSRNAGSQQEQRDSQEPTGQVGRVQQEDWQRAEQRENYQRKETERQKELPQ